MSHMHQLGAVAFSFLLVLILIIYGTLTKSRTRKHLMFWLVFIFVLGGSLIFNAAFR
jgi:predicted MFS family arabinose efflux permease